MFVQTDLRNIQTIYNNIKLYSSMDFALTKVYYVQVSSFSVENNNKSSNFMKKYVNSVLYI